MGLVQSIAEVFRRFRRLFSPSTSEREENAAHALGRRGEDLAVRHLRRNGYKLLYRNFRHPRGGEVDIVCRDRRTGELVFIEVKTRRTRDFGDPAHAVDEEKRHLISRGAVAWLRLLDFPDVRYRFDIVEVIAGDDAPVECSVVKSAFTLPKPYRA